MKKIILSVSCFVAAILANAQTTTFEWAKNLGGTGNDYGESVAVDASGNVYTAGYFEGTVDFDPGAGTFNLTSEGYTDIFVSKLDGSGNFVWAKSMGSILTDKAYSIAVDAAGNVYTTGVFDWTADFDPGPGTFYLTGYYDIFISKLNSSGDFVWAKSMVGSHYDYCQSIALDASGNVFTTGYFQDTVDFDPGAGTYNLISTNGSDMFVLKLDASGNFVWTKQINGSPDEVGESIAVDASGYIYTTGYFVGPTDFDPGAGTFNLNGSGMYDIFILKLDASGNFVWAKKIGGANIDVGNAIAVDASGNVYTHGVFSGTVDFDPGTGTFNLTSAGGSFISKLDVSGNFLWAKQTGGGSTYNELSQSIAVDASGYVYNTGHFSGTQDFDPGAGTFNLTTTGGNDIFISKLDASGNFLLAKQMGGTSDDWGRSIKVVASNNIYVTGVFNTTGDFDPNAGIFNLTSSGARDIFVHKMSQCTPPSAIITPAGPTTFCSGNSVLLNANIGIGFSYQWKKNGTDISGATSQNYTAIALGSYTVVVSNPCGSAASSAVTVTVNSLPSATITPAGPTTFCSGGSVALNAVVAANRTYQWKKGANLISGATLSSYTASVGGNYKVIVTNTVTGCSKTTGSATVVTVNALPTATITPQGPTTFCAGGSVVLAANTGTGLSYKWKKGTNFISGATLPNYTATTGGNYKVQVTNSNGCSKTSGNVAVSVPCKEGENEKVRKWESEMNVSVFPNPNSGEFTIKFSTKPTSPIQIELTDEIGKVVKRFEANDETVVIKESNLAMGIYFLKVQNNEEVVIRKINIIR